MNSKHRKTLAAVFAKPTSGAIAFKDVESLLVALGCELTEGAGSRERFDKDGLAYLCHRPHPGKEAKRYQIEDVRQFLERLEIKP